MLAGIFIGLGIAAIMWLTWYLAPLGDPETGAGRQDLREGATLSNVKRHGSNGPPPCPRPPPPPSPPHGYQPVDSGRRSPPPGKE